MCLKVCVLGSGSSGNCIYVASARTGVLVDAGLSGREIVRRLQLVGADMRAVDAVCVTHEHTDHQSALNVLHRRFGPRLYANSGTIEGIRGGAAATDLPWNVFTTGQPFSVGDLQIEPFSVPHDSYDPVGFVIGFGACRVGIVTDMGIATTLIRERLRRCRALVVECNHDEEMLRDSRRPWALKQRIASRQGHLSNAQAGELLAGVAGRDLEVAFLAHLSSECNRPKIALRTVTEALAKAGQGHVAVRLTYPDRPAEMVACGDTAGAAATA